MVSTLLLILYFVTNLAVNDRLPRPGGSLVLGRTPTGLRDLTAYSLGYLARTNAYLFLLTPRVSQQRPRSRRAAPRPGAAGLAR